MIRPHVLGSSPLALCVVLATGCGTTRPSEPAPVPVAAAPTCAPVSASAPSPSASPAGSAPAPAAGSERVEAVTAAFAEGTLDRRVFRHLLVGALRYPPRRLTWVLFRTPTRARLQVFCQAGLPASQTGMSLSGKENDEALWRPPILTEYAGARAEGETLSYRLSVAAAPAGEPGCEPLPAALDLACQKGEVEVLTAGAALIPGKKRADDRVSPARWDPAARGKAAGLRCDVKAEGDAGQRLGRVISSSPLFFAAGKEGSPGVEWADENSDQVVQEGAYRWMPQRP